MFGIKVQMVKDNRGALEVEADVDRLLSANREALRSSGSKNSLSLCISWKYMSVWGLYGS